MSDVQNDHDILIGMRSELRLELGNIKNEIKELKTNSARTGDDHETRIRTLEAARWKIIGIASAVSGIITLAGVVIAYLAINGHG